MQPGCAITCQLSEVRVLQIRGDRHFFYFFFWGGGGLGAGRGHNRSV